MTLAAGDFFAAAGGRSCWARPMLSVTFFTPARQPRVIGEIKGGLLLGLTVLGALAPRCRRRCSRPRAGRCGPRAGTTRSACCCSCSPRCRCARSSAAARHGRRAGHGRRGLPLRGRPAAVPRHRLLQPARRRPERHGAPAVFGLAIAVTSIPVISRIMFDLGIIETPFARIVLGVAVIEDIIVYVVLLAPWAWWPPVEARRWASRPARAGAGQLGQHGVPRQRDPRVLRPRAHSLARAQPAGPGASGGTSWRAAT